MITVALRFSDNYAPQQGTIELHEKVINQKGYVWYGKKGLTISNKAVEGILKDEKSRIILIKSGSNKRYFAYVEDIKKDLKAIDDISAIPSYYRKQAGEYGAWFKVVRFEEIDNTILDDCYVISSSRRLSDSIKRSMSPSFLINYVEE